MAEGKRKRRGGTGDSKGAGDSSKRRIEIVDNGPGGLIAFFGSGGADVHRRIYDADYKTVGTKLVRSIRYTRVWVGKDPRPEVRDRRGHSLLLATPEGKLVWVGNMGVQEFALAPEDSVKAFVSEIGNASVPYPYVRGAKNTYLLLERVIVPNQDLDVPAEFVNEWATAKGKPAKPASRMIDGRKDPYGHFYARQGRGNELPKGVRRMRMRTLVRRPV